MIPNAGNFIEQGIFVLGTDWIIKQKTFEMKISIEHYSKDDKPITADHHFKADKYPIDVTGKVKRSVKELGKNLHHFIVDWQNTEAVLPKNWYP